MCAITITFLVAFDNGDVANSFRRIPQTLRETLSQTLGQTLGQMPCQTMQINNTNVTGG